MQTVPEEEWPIEQSERAATRADFDPQWGDRCVELVIIGISMDKDAVHKDLKFILYLLVSDCLALLKLS